MESKSTEKWTEIDKVGRDIQSVTNVYDRHIIAVIHVWGENRYLT